MAQKSLQSPPQLNNLPVNLPAEDSSLDAQKVIEQVQAEEVINQASNSIIVHSRQPQSNSQSKQPDNVQQERSMMRTADSQKQVIRPAQILVPIQDSEQPSMYITKELKDLSPRQIKRQRSHSESESASELPLYIYLGQKKFKAIPDQRPENNIFIKHRTQELQSEANNHKWQQEKIAMQQHLKKTKKQIQQLQGKYEELQKKHSSLLEEHEEVKQNLQLQKKTIKQLRIQLQNQGIEKSKLKEELDARCVEHEPQSIAEGTQQTVYYEIQNPSSAESGEIFKDYDILIQEYKKLLFFNAQLKKAGSQKDDQINELKYQLLQARKWLKEKNIRKHFASQASSLFASSHPGSEEEPKRSMTKKDKKGQRM